MSTGRVLVVDDDLAVCTLIADILDVAGIQAQCVQSDMGAYSELVTIPTYKAVIVDVNLGRGTTGFDVARFARKVVPNIPVIYVSGEAHPQSCQSFGVPDGEFVGKPFTPEEIIQVLRKRLEPDSP
jgi:CheY-like chemotaxis protein